jgi:serine protease Do
MKLKSLSLALIAAGVVATGTANAVGWSPAGWFDKKPTTSQSNAAPNIAPAAAPVAAMAAPNYRAIVEQYGPAVVGINTQGIAQTSGKGIPEGMSDDPFFRFFRDMPGFNGQMPQGEVPTRGMGSGFIISKDGLILTNAHVVDEAAEVIVKLSDRREYKAKVLGSDPATDVAVLKIDAADLPVVTMGSPAKLGVGDYVLAIGSPFGFEQSATAGIVSAKGRSLPGDGYVPFIQTDVAVNPGNSGGPLFDTSGSVVGINSQIYSRSGGYQGVSFAIPIDVALRVKDQIVATGKASHARLGVSIQELTQSLAESFKLKHPNGALVSSVTPGSAAAKAGLESGDVILAFNSQPIGRSGDLPALVGAAKPGDKTTLEVWRAGKKLELSAVLGEAKDQVAGGESGAGSAPQGKLGVAVRPLTGEEKAAAKVASGVLVEQAAGPAARAGIQPGDIVISVNGTPIKSVEQLQSFVAKEATHLALLVQRGGSKIFIPVPLG